MNASPAQPPTASPAHDPDELARRLGTSDAAVIGVGSMVGAGVFVAFAPAAAHAGSLLPVALLLAAVVAWCNATSTAQLAMVHPASGGTYVYANRQLGQWAGFTAGWGFVTGKTASAAGMSMAFGLYAATLLGIDDADAAARALAVAAIVVLTGVNLGGITRTAGLTRILVSVVLLILAVVALARIRRAPRKGTVILTSIIALVIGLWSLLGGGARLLFWDQVSAYDTCVSTSVTIAGTSSCQQELEDGLRESILPGSVQDGAGSEPTS